MFESKLGVKYSIESKTDVGLNYRGKIKIVSSNDESVYKGKLKIPRFNSDDLVYKSTSYIPEFMNESYFKSNITLANLSKIKYFHSTIEIINRGSSVSYNANIRISNLYNRYPFYVFNLNRFNESIHKEVLYDGASLYLNVNDSIVKTSEIIINQMIDSLMNTINNSISGKYNSIDDMIRTYNRLDNKIEDIITGDITNNIMPLNNMIEKFNGLDKKMNLSTEINNLYDIGIDSGVLSENDFDNDYKRKLDSAQEGAKKYKHPIRKQCGYISPIQSVFGRIGDVEITKEDFGLQYIDPNANNYIHPRAIQCSPIYVKSVNKLSMPNILISKGTIGLNRVTNGFPSRGRDNIINKVDDQYLVMDDTTREYIQDRINEIKSIPAIDNRCTLSVSIDHNPDTSTNPLHSSTIVTLYTKTLDISRLYTIRPTHEFNILPGKYLIKIEGYDGISHIIKTKHINVYKDMDIEIELREGI